MNFQDISFHNVAELDSRADGGGHLLRRFPRELLQCLSPIGRVNGANSAGCEIRFVTDAPRYARLSVGSLGNPYGHESVVSIFRGPYPHSTHRLTPGINHLHLETTPFADNLAPRASAFSPQAWRILFGEFPAIFYGLDTFGNSLRPPQAGETPALRWLAYGSSITQGGGAPHHNSYIYHAAFQLKADVYNQGLAGSCLAEPEMADYLAGRTDWDVITLELGVNMVDAFTVEAFAGRAGALIEKVIRAHPLKPVFVVTIFPNFNTPGFAADPTAIATTRTEAFRECLRQIVSAANHPRLHLIEGSDILSDFDGLSADLIHPGDHGHALMGRQLAKFMRPGLSD